MWGLDVKDHRINHFATAVSLLLCRPLRWEPPLPLYWDDELEIVVTISFLVSRLAVCSSFSSVITQKVMIDRAAWLSWTASRIVRHSPSSYHPLLKTASSFRLHNTHFSSDSGHAQALKYLTR